MSVQIVIGSDVVVGMLLTINQCNVWYYIQHIHISIDDVMTPNNPSTTSEKLPQDSSFISTTYNNCHVMFQKLRQ